MTLSARLVTGIVFVCLAAAAQANDRDPDAAALKYRQSLMTVVVANVAPIAGMVKGRTAFDGGQMALRAERISMLSGMIEEAFARDTRGADLETEALDVIWENQDDFAAKALKLGETSEALAAAARRGEDAAKDAFKTMAGACKGCHDDYRMQDD